jgi:menaquinone-9 beta-reductase
MSTEAPIGIVGAGPGGLYAAMRLAQQGIPSVVFEKATFPRPKVCGDILTSNVIRALHDLDPNLVQDLLKQPWAMELKATAFGSAKKKGFEMPFHSPGNQQLGLPSCISARRIDFDAWLLHHAQQYPLIQIRQNTRIDHIERTADGFLLTAHTQQLATGPDSREQLTTGNSSAGNRSRFSGETGNWSRFSGETGIPMAIGRKLATKFLILATGANSPLVKEMVPGQNILPKHSAVGMRAYYKGAAAHATAKLSEFYLFDKQFMPGGLYITPFADGTVNVNVVMRLDVFQKRKPKLQDLVRTYLQAHPQLRERFATATQEGIPAGCTLFFGTHKRPLSSPNCLLVGDAAGLTDATNANGIGHAMISGGIAANFLTNAIQHGTALDGYDAAVYARLKNALLPGKVMKTLFANPITAGMSVSLLNASLNRLNSKAIQELVYSTNASWTLLNPKFYWRLFVKG